MSESILVHIKRCVMETTSWANGIMGMKIICGTVLLYLRMFTVILIQCRLQYRHMLYEEVMYEDEKF